MSRPTLSDAQRRAAYCAFADALVNAGAGSGKTRVLSERFVHLVREGAVGLRRLAALTFTEKAAAQMRQRIAGLFRDLQADATGAEAEALAGWRADVEFAPISTIHSFCASLLRQHAVEAGLDPAFEVLDAMEADLLESDAADLAEQVLAAEEPALVQVLSVVGGEARSDLLSLLRRLRGAGSSIEALGWKAGEGDVDDALEAVQTQVPLLVAGRECLEPERHAQFDAALVRIEDLVARARGDEEVSPFLAAQAHAAVAQLKGPKKKIYQTPRAALDRALVALTGALLDRWGARVLLPALKKVLAAYAASYQRLKDERPALDFTDLELRVRDLLSQAATREEALDLAPHGLLVDEYQDTNPLQAGLLRHLRDAGEGVAQFAVGDPKQSIYRFRGADVSVIVTEEDVVGTASVFPMHASYRSCPPLVDAVNALNERLFAGGAAGVRYDPLVAAGAFLPTPDPLVELTILDGGKGSDIARTRAAEAASIADRIHTLVVGGVQRLAPKRAGGLPTEASIGALRYGDIAMLFRAGTDIPIYEAALAARGIPFLTQNSKGYFQSPEMVDLVYVLRAVHNPEDRFALACMATGPAMGATDDELLRWFQRDSAEQDAQSPWERMIAEAEAGGRHAGTVATLQRLRVEAAGGALAQAVERALVDLGLYEGALLCPGGDRAAANLRKAIQVARSLDAGGRRGLDDLLRHLATMRDRETGEAEAPTGGEADNVVRLTTIHGAKGLEYPVVFVPDIGRLPRGNSDRIQFDGKQQIAVRVADPLEGLTCTPAGYTAIQEAEKEADAQEALRVLYVAMTRAEERLYLSGICKGTTKGRPSTFSGWGKAIWEALAIDFEPGTQDVSLPLLTAAPDAAAGAPRAATVRLHIRQASSVDVPRAPEAVTDTPPVSDASLALARRRIAEAEAPVATLGNTRFVVSVSELLTFAASPQRYYEERVLFAGARSAAAAAWDTPSHEVDTGTAADDLARRERWEEWDEHEPQAMLTSGSQVEAPASASDGLDRAAVGRAVHAVLEHVRAGDETAPEGLLEQAVEAERGDDSFAAAVRLMVNRFLASAVGDKVRAALREGADVRREVALHARIRFPGGELVGGYDSLLVKGSIDLWLPTEAGVLVLDHKTNQRGGAFKTPEALADHYRWQLRLYALATERALGTEVAGGQLLLLDASWGPEALAVPVDVSGDALEETRRLCRAFALAELEGRYPTDWRSLLA